MKILVIEDDRELATMVERVLSQTGFRVEVASDGNAGLQRALGGRFGLVILDLMLPGMDGMRVCERLRSQRKGCPILMITARDAVADRVKGLECGADDYLPKPFDVREFLARVHALLRRDRMYRARTVRIGRLRLDTQQRHAHLGLDLLKLTRQEYAILELLATNAGKVVTRTALEEFVWEDMTPDRNTMDVAVRALRRKLSEAGCAGWIETVYGIGYRMLEAEAVAER